MALVVKDRVKVTSTTTGTADFTLGTASLGFQSFAAIGNGNETYYAAADSVTGDWEVGIGTYSTTGPTLTRTTILESSAAGAKVSFGAGSKDVFCTYPAERSVYVDTAGSYPVQNTFNTLNATTATLTGGTVATTPTSGTDLVNKTYVDTVAAQGIVYHNPVYVESPNTAGNLNATYNQPGGAGVGVGATLTNAGTQVPLTIDGVLMTVGKRVLIYNQTSAFQNGVYTVTTVGTVSTNWVLTRATDADTYAVNSPTSLGQGDAFYVQAGNTGAGELYSCNTVGTITFGTTAITFAQISATVPYFAGTGLNLNPATTFNISDVGTAGTYGSASNVPVLTTNAQGQVTSVTNTGIAITSAAVSGLAASATTDTTNAANITSGTLPSGRIAGSYTGLTGTGALTAGSLGAGFTTVAAARGGTGQTSYAIGDLLYASTTTALSKLADVAVGNALISGGVGSAPSYGKIGLATHVSGTLPVLNGGTGVTSSTGTGSVVLSDSPSLVTPALGTPSALVGTNITGTASGLSIGGNAATATSATTATTATNQSGGTVNATSLAASGTVTFSGGTANGVTYLNGTDVLTSGTALTFDGSTLGVTVASSTDALRITQTGTGNALLVEDSTNPDATPVAIDASGNLLVGTTTALTISGITPAYQQLGSGNYSGIWSGRYAANSSANFLYFSKSRSATVGGNAVISNNDDLGTLAFYGDDGTNLIHAASIFAEVDGTPGTNDMPGRLMFSTTADGASTPTERMRIDSAGRVDMRSSMQGATSTASTISGVTLTVGGTVTGTFDVGDRVFGVGVEPNTTIVAFGTGTGGAGTYTIDNSQTVASTAISATGAGLNVFRFTDTDASTAVNQPMGTIEWFGSDVSTPGAGVKAYITSVSESTVPDAAMIFGTSDNVASTQAVERMRISGTGNLGLGATPTAATGTVLFANRATGGTAVRGVVNDMPIQSDVTSTFRAYSSQAYTAAAAFTLTSLTHFFANPTAFGAGSTVTNQFGFSVSSTMTGAGTNIGFYGNIPAGTNDWNFYAAGTADNYFAGNVGIGVTTPTSRLTITDATNLVTPLTVDSGSGADATRGIALNVSGVNYGRILVPSGSGGAMALWTGAAGAAAERMRIDSSGNLLLGTTTQRQFVTASQNAATGTAIEIGNANTANNVTKTAGYNFSGTDTVGTYKPTGSVIVGPAEGNYVASYMAFNTRIADTVAERMRINSSGNVGIGTVSPARLLDVFGYAQMQNPNGAKLPSYILPKAPVLQIAGGDANENNPGSIGLITPGINVTVGQQRGSELYFVGSRSTTTQLAASTFTALGAGDNIGRLTFGGDNGVNLRSIGAAIQGNAGSTWSATNLESYLAFSTAASGSAGVTERMRIAASGNIGMGGNTNPATALDVTGTVTATTFSGAGTSLTGTAASLSIGGNAATVTNGLYTTGGQTIAAKTTQQGGQTATMITASSGLGGFELQSAGASAAAFMAFHRPSAYAAYFGIDTDNNFAVGGWSAGAALGSMKVGSFGVGTAASGTAGEIRATNNITAYYSSDRKFKENITEITSAGSIVRAIGGKYFDWTDAYIADHGGEDGYFVQKQDFGVIAQDVLRVFPRAVRTRPDGSLAVDYEKLGVLAFPALVETMNRLDALEQAVANLTAGR